VAARCISLTKGPGPLVRHAMHRLQSPDVMRFLGRKIITNFSGELVTSFNSSPSRWMRSSR
jgi:hypothetical protein